MSRYVARIVRRDGNALYLLRGKLTDRAHIATLMRYFLTLLLLSTQACAQQPKEPVSSPLPDCTVVTLRDGACVIRASRFTVVPR